MLIFRISISALCLVGIGSLFAVSAARDLENPKRLGPGVPRIDPGLSLVLSNPKLPPGAPASSYLEVSITNHGDAPLITTGPWILQLDLVAWDGKGNEIRHTHKYGDFYFNGMNLTQRQLRPGQTEAWEVYPSIHFGSNLPPGVYDIQATWEYKGSQVRSQKVKFSHVPG